jgi:hypothetical protein
MAKNYLDQLGDWVKKKESKHRDKNLVAFLAVRADVKTAVEAGYKVKTVWLNMYESKRIQFGYHTFLNYVNRLIRNQKINQTAKAEPSETPENKKRVTEIINPLPMPEFKYNSVSPKLEELF